MIPITLVLGFSFLALFLWANEDGQYDDLDSPAHRILDDEDEILKDNKE